METPEFAARRVFGERAATYTTSSAHTDPHVLERVVALSHAQSNWTALDIATGTGHTAFAVAPHVARVAGVDLTPEMLIEARRLSRRHGVTNVAFGLADARWLPFLDQSFELATCRRAAHHFSDLRRALREMRRVLRPGGRLVVDDRSVPEDDFADALMNELDRLHDESHVREYRPSEWTTYLEEAGFCVEMVDPYVKPRPLSSLTNGVSAEYVERMYGLLDVLNEAQRRTFNLDKRDGELWCNHWFVMLAAVKM
ncbi:MAG: methyltransferase domain-containing protein [Candidatus Hydrogenedentes bacterium]|nr:methyltransferase domain-containing protein [Candidatus Hydrogenedentota bacterium]